MVPRLNLKVTRQNEYVKSAYQSFENGVVCFRFLSLSLVHRQFSPQILLLRLQVLQFPHHLLQLLCIDLDHISIRPRLRFVNLSLDAGRPVVHTSFVGLLLTKPFSWHPRVLLRTIVIAVLLYQMNSGVLQNQRFLILVGWPRFVVILVLAVWMFEIFPVGGLERDIWGNLEIHAGSVGLVDWEERLVFVAIVAGPIQVYH